ncbi:hypothetical protein NDU88_012028 [Pleurodeles waltl]|uniref:Uncharacterized protein n=1 Tax=Pleurodeles waltl TaxID=8319 RepID=A0AAV7R3G8_PLEWA|nr:hypothetical protein NDU88_012028 [Pleurodeles waltl]
MAVFLNASVEYILPFSWAAPLGTNNGIFFLESAHCYRLAQVKRGFLDVFVTPSLAVYSRSLSLLHRGRSSRVFSVVPVTTEAARGKLAFGPLCTRPAGEVFLVHIIRQLSFPGRVRADIPLRTDYAPHQEELVFVPSQGPEGRTRLGPCTRLINAALK